MAQVKIGYLRVLIVDDSGVSRTMTHDLLKKAGFKHIDEAASANQAHDKMDALKYDIVFLDWMMPGKSGVSLMGEWREDSKYDDVAVVIVSMQDHEGLVAGALKAGANSYIIKPATEAKVQKSLEKVLKWLEMRKSSREEQNS